MRRCDYKRRTVEQQQPYGLRFARQRRCQADATHVYQSDPRYYDASITHYRCPEHALGIGWVLIEVGEKQ